MWDPFNQIHRYSTKPVGIFNETMSLNSHGMRYICMVRLRRMEIPGCVYHVIFSPRHHLPILKGKIADLIASEIINLGKMTDCILVAWCIMPDHVHILFQPPDGQFSRMVKQVKGRTGKALKPGFPALDRFWDRRYFDYRLRSRDAIYDEASYIENNPLRAGLCGKPEDWKWSSAFVREYGENKYMND